MRASTTRRQHDLLVFIRAYIAEHDGVAPSYDEMMAALDLRGRAAVFHLVERLVERGHLERTPNRARALRVIEPGESGVEDRARAEAWQEGYAAALRDYGISAVTKSRVGPHSGAVKPRGAIDRIASGPFSPFPFNRV